VEGLKEAGVSVLGMVVVALAALIAIGAFVFWIWALIDAIRVPDDSLFRAGNKLLWVIVLVFLHVIGAIIYVAVGRPAAA
jgi:hypothetical protein